MKTLIEKLMRRENLTAAETEAAFDAIMAGSVDQINLSAFLTLLRAKGETPEEIAAAARAMRQHAVKVETAGDTIDTCGTGGDYSGTFNISTAVAFVLAGAGCKVAKHGNRSQTSSSGSADCLEALGVPIDLNPQAAAAAIADRGFAFMFAPSYHPAMKNVMPVRKQLGLRTVFNILGPLSNPAGAAYQVLGVFDEKLIEPLAEVLKLLGTKGAMVVGGGLDEVSIVQPTRYARLSGGQISYGQIEPAALGIQAENLDALKVVSPAQSAEMVERVLRGELKGPCRDIVAVNAAAAFMALDDKLDIQAGLAMAGAVLSSGKAYAALNQARQ
ncbi:MAG: Anthranilate phosphoribosyltransferase [Deltaproteobacteria bacterium ADurb.Bin510]|nr:MAG: Anthranilate phosphoribosyltransferase [Deltaproteobacteria bacterium ADurb.Bin510]